MYCEQCVPYLICMSSDVDVNIRLKADQQLLEIDKKYTGFIQVTCRQVYNGLSVMP